MRETQFIIQNKEKWTRFEQMLEDKNHNPEELNELFIQITDDLSYARTFYPNRSVRVFLNGLARRIFHNVYSHRRFPMTRLRTFWTEELPRVMYESRKALLLSFVLFALAFLIGVVSSQINPEFARTILGDSYVETTLDNIEKGDPMAIYKDKEVLGMSLGIAANNLRVAFFTVLMGVLSSIGTVFIMLYNGIMVGAFQYFFITKGLFWESFLTIWIHGTLEISAIIIAGGAGLVLGSGLLFPGSYTRMQAFQMSAKRGIKIFIGIVPIIIIAGIFEGVLTRATDVPMLIRGLFILMNAAFVLWYFVMLPWSRARRGAYAQRVVYEKEPLPKKIPSTNYGAIKSAGQLFSDTFNFFAYHGHRVYARSFLGAVVVLITSLLFLDRVLWAKTFVFLDGPFWAFGTLRNSETLFGHLNAPFLLPLQITLLSAFSVWIFHTFQRILPKQIRVRPDLKGFVLRACFLAPVIFLFIWLFTLDLNIFSFFLLSILYPFLGIWAVSIYFKNLNPLAALSWTVKIINWQRAVLLGFSLCGFIGFLFLFLESGIFGIIVEFVGWNSTDLSDGTKSFELSHILFFVSSFCHFVAFALIMVASVFLFYTCREINTAYFLYEKMKSLGKDNKIRGLARE